MAAVLAALVAAGCSRSPREQARMELLSVRSWAASAQMVGERWMERAVPDRYAKRALASFVKKIESERSKASAADLPARAKAHIVAAFDSTARATDSLLRVVERGDRAAAAHITARLAARARDAHSMSERLRAK